jgi:hypothetical protein
LPQRQVFATIPGGNGNGPIVRFVVSVKANPLSRFPAVFSERGGKTFCYFLGRLLPNKAFAAPL